MEIRLQPPSPTFNRNADLFPRLRQAYVTDDHEEEVVRQRLRRHHSAQQLRSTALDQEFEGYGQARRRTASHGHSAPTTPPRKVHTKHAYTAPSSPSRRPPRPRVEPIRRMRSFDEYKRTALSRSPSSASSSSSKSTNSGSESGKGATSSSASSLMEDILPWKPAKLPLKLPLPDRSKTLARATEAFQYGLIAFGAAVALWTLFAVLFASYGLTALDSFTNSTRWLRNFGPVRRKTKAAVSDGENAVEGGAPKRPPMSSLIPTLMFTLLVWGGDQAARGARWKTRTSS